jgi:putative addiction module component (TIGR02574 family)
MATPPIDIASLSIDERISLIDALWESLSRSPDTVALSPEQEAELDKRLDEIDRGEVSGESWETLRDHLREKLS